MVSSCLLAADEFQKVSLKNPAAFTELGRNYDLELDGLVEGLAKGVSIEIINETGFPLKDLTSKVTCGCLKVVGLETVDVEPGGALKMRFAILPTYGGFEQKCLVSGITQDGLRKELFTLTVKGNVVTPIRVAQVAAPIDEFAKGVFSTSLKCVDGVKVDYTSISSDSDLFEVSGDQASAMLTLTPKAKVLEECAFIISIPFKWKDRQFTHSINFQVVDEMIRLSPARLYFRKSPNGRVGRLFVNSKGAGFSPQDFSVSIVGVDGVVYVDGFTFQRRDINDFSSFFELVIDESLASKAKEIRLETKQGKTLFTRTAKCVFD